MQFIDLNDGRIDTMLDIHRDWLACGVCASFRDEILETMLATINGRNDLEIIGLTNREINNIIVKLMKEAN